MHWKDALARAARTLIQIGTLSAVVGLLAIFDVINWTEEQTAAVLTVGGIVITFLQNFLEDAMGHALFYKDNAAQRTASAERLIERASP